MDIDLETGLDDDHAPVDPRRAQRPREDALIELKPLDAKSALDFVDFPRGAVGSADSSPHVVDVGGEEGDSLLGSGGGSRPSRAPPAAGPSGDAGASLLSAAFYRQFFDVNTQQVLMRLKRALVPSPDPFYRDDDVPDLYGPFWITTTLVFLMAVTGNFANYLSHITSTEGKAEWRSDFKKLSVAASSFYSLIIFMPVIAYFLLARIGQPKALSELVSLYGYSLFVFVPTSMVSVLPFEPLRWLAVLASFCLSALFLARNLWSSANLTPANRSLVMTFLGLVVAVQFFFAVLMKFYFFTYDDK